MSFRHRRVNNQTSPARRVINIDQAINSLRQDIRRPLTDRDDRAHSFNLLAKLLLNRFQQKGRSADLDEAVLMGREALQLCPPPHDYAPEIVDILAAVLLARYESSNQLGDLEEGILMLQQAVELQTDADDRALCLHNLATAILDRFQHCRQPSDLDEVISLRRQVVELQPSPKRNRSAYLIKLSEVLLARFEQGGRSGDLDEAISFRRETLKLQPPPNINQSMLLFELADILFAGFERMGQSGYLDEAISLRRKILELQPPTNPSRPESLIILTKFLFRRFQHNDQMNDLDEGALAVREGLELCPPAHPKRAELLSVLAMVLLARNEKGRQLADLDEGILLLRQALELEARSIPFLDNLASALSNRFIQRRQSSDAKEAIALRRQIIELLPRPNPYRSKMLAKLSEILEIQSQFEQERGDQTDNEDKAISERLQILDLQAERLDTHDGEGQPHDLNKVILLHQKALELSPTHDPDRSETLNNLAIALLTRYKHSMGRNKSDLSEGISLLQEALKPQISDEIRIFILHNLADALKSRFQESSDPTDLDEVVLLRRQIIKLLPPQNPEQSHYLDRLSFVLYTRFKNKGLMRDLEEAISYQRQAITLQPHSHPNRSDFLHDLALMLLDQSTQGDNLAEAIMLERQALQLRPLPHPNRWDSLDYLAYALATRYELEGRQDDLLESISLNREALELLPLPKKYISQHHLANTLLMRYMKGGKSGGQIKDADEAVLLNRKALELQPPSDRYIAIANLASALFTRSRLEGSEGGLPTDMNEAISLLREAVELLPGLDIRRSHALSGLAAVLSFRIHNTSRNKTDALNEAISLRRQTLELCPSPHPQRAAFLLDFAITLLMRAENMYSQADVDDAILLLQEALELQAPSNSITRSIIIKSLARAREMLGGQENIKEAILLMKESIELRPFLHPAQSNSYTILGRMFMEVHIQSADKSDKSFLEQAMSSFSMAVQSAPPRGFQRLRPAQMWSTLADTHDHSSAIDAYDALLQGLRDVASLSRDIHSRQELLSAVADGLPRKAARCAIGALRLDKAIEFLEAGRAIFWSQVLQLRSPLKLLRDSAPELADTLQNLANELERGSHRDAFPTGILVDNMMKTTVEEEASYFRRLNEQWHNAVDEIRELEGFKDFLKPHQLSSLQAAAVNTPIVFLVANDNRNDCLVMTSTSIHHIPLLDLSPKELFELVKSMRSALQWTALRSLQDLEQDRLGARFVRPNTSDGIFKAVLKVLWNKVVKPIIDILGLQKSEYPPVLQWCPTGLFTFLPIHAAGCYDSTGADECAPDYFVSSYIPTIGVILSPVSPSTAPEEQFKMLTVMNSSLGYAQTELEKIKKRVPKDCLVQLGVPGSGSPAEVDTVFSHLPSAAIVHFACHGKQDRVSPLNSALLVNEEDHEGLMISKIMQQQLPNGSLAFLCACETAMGDETVPDEAMSLGASLLFSGFRKVVATMWKMYDVDGPTIADAFYEELFRGPDGNPSSRPDINNSAWSLHNAVKKLRSDGVAFHRWVPFIHLGM